MTRFCPICSHPLPDGTRARFCPRCSFQGALELAEEDAIAPLGEGQVIGDYEMLEQLGRGGMGIVYRARQRTLNRFVAVKLLLAGEFADAPTRNRFATEASSTALLRHPNIVTIHEVGVHEGQPYLSMELIEGRTFADLVRDGPLHANDAARLLKPIADAVQFAHEQGILHRDLKPSNLLIDQFGVPRVTDFGLARRLDSMERHTLTGEVLGSPSYLAPEQARGDRAKEGPATDVYALGAILYHLLTGRPPFAGSSPQSILRSVLETEPVAVKILNPGVPRDLETICQKCLDKEPSRRYATAKALAEELERYLCRRPIEARPIGPLSRAWRWTARHPAAAGLIGALAVTLLTLAIVPSAAYLRVRRAEREQAVQLRETLLSQARAIRLSGQYGQKRESWKSLELAAQIDAPDDTGEFRQHLRREAIANLALADAWFEPDPIIGGSNDPTLICFDARKEIFAAGTFRGKIQIYRRDGGPMHESILTNETLQHVIEFSPDTKTIAVRQGKQIAMWEPASGRKILAKEAGLNQFSFISNGAAAVFIEPARATCHSLRTGEEIWQRPLSPPGGRGPVACSPGGRWLAIGRGDKPGVDLYDLDSSAIVHLTMPCDPTVLTWSENSRWMTAGGAEGSLCLWDTESISENGAALWTVETRAGRIQGLAFSPDRRWLAAAATDETIRILDVSTRRLAFTVPGIAYRLGFSPEGNRVGPIWQGGTAGWLCMTNALAAGTARYEARTFAPALAVNEPGSMCAVASESEILIYKANLAEAPVKVPYKNARAVYFLPGNQLMAVAYGGHGLWSVLDPNKPLSLEGSDSYGGRGGEVVTFSADHQTIAFANYPAGTVEVMQSGQLKHRLGHHRVCCAALNPAGTQLVSTSLDEGETFLWDVESGGKLSAWPDDGGNRVVFSPDGKWLAQFGPRCVVRDTATWQARPLLQAVAPNVSTSDAAFSPDNRWLAVIMADREVHLLAVKDFSPVAVFESPTKTRLHRLAWTKAGDRLAILASQNEIQIWNLDRMRTGLRSLGADWK